MRPVTAAVVAVVATGGCLVALLYGQRTRRPLRKAVCVLTGAAMGRVAFEEFGPFIIFPGYLRVSGVVAALKPGFHGMHVHQFGDTTNGCMSTGVHFNPTNSAHGAPWDVKRHVGDLGNILAGPDGRAFVLLYDQLASLSGPNSVVGRALVVHELPDDLGRGDNSEPWPSTTQGKSSKTTGNAGARVACGVIGLSSA